jgi:hypothetical protein
MSVWWAVLVSFCATSHALLMPSFCANLPPTECINVELSQLNLTLNADQMVESDALSQLDEVAGEGREPGNWQLILDGAQLRESSRIRLYNDSQCPGETVFGTLLRFSAESQLIGGSEREFRVVFSIENADAWIGVAFAVRDDGENQFRVLAHQGCLVLQQRANGSPYLLLASSQRGIVVDQQYELRVRYGNDFILARLFEWPSLDLVSAISNTNIRETADNLGGDYALFSSNSDASLFASFILVDTRALPSVNELKPVTDEPTPAPTPVPTASPTPAPTPVPAIDCAYSAWSDWSECSQAARCMLEAGTQSRTRTITRQSSGAGVPCGALSQSQICNADVPCPTPICNCVGCSTLSLTGSATWCRCCQFASNPNCTSNACTTNNIHVKRDCQTAGWCQVINATATKHCGVDWHPNDDYCNLPIACQVSGWSDFAPCTRSCASVAPGETPNGTQTRSRNVTRAAKNGGTPCPSLTESVVCNTTPCPQDCVVGEWGAFAPCTARCTAQGAVELYIVAGLNTRTRTIMTTAANNGTACPSLRDDMPCSIECTPDVDCVVSGYGQWSNCQVATPDPACAMPPNTPRACGNGVMTRTRSVVRQPLGNGLRCPTTYTKNDTCSVQCSVNCAVSEWSEWSTCSRTCGSGTQRRTRTVTVSQQFCGTACPQLGDQRSCFLQTCAPSTMAVDCVISDY